MNNQPFDALTRLEARHRLEEVAARFGLFLELEEHGVCLPHAQLAHVHYQGRALTPNTIRAIVFPFGLAADERGLSLPYGSGRRSIEGWEDALLRFLEHLLEEDPAAFLKRPERRIHIPRDGEMPRSAAFLERFYGDDFLPREKKPAVVDLRGCQGPFLRSVDDDPLQIVDAASQIASLAAGFRPDAAQAALDDGAFDPFLVAAPAPDSPEAAPAFEALRAALLEVAPAGLEHVAFVNAGAEANEKALHIARVNGPGGHRVLAFHGSFHGRTLLSLFSTYNPAKRAPYQLPGFETTFLDLPVADDPYADPLIPDDWRAAWADVQGARAFEGDALLQAEVAALVAVEQSILAGDVLACLVEPYQCEGGDRSASRRFFNGLRALTRGHGVPLIFDEVQSGFGLSGEHIFWHQRFKLLDAAGRPDSPDLVVGAKRAQLGYVLSRWPDPALTTAHAASAVRGLQHLRLVQDRPGHAEHARQRLEVLAARWGHVISRPRVFGDAFAFDLPNSEAANHLIGQRFYRGYMVYIAGQRTLRYRLNRGMRAAEVDAIFHVIERSLEALVYEAGGEGPQLAERLAACTPAQWERPPAPPALPALPTAGQLLADPGPLAADNALRQLGALGRVDLRRAMEHLGLPLDASPAAVRAAVVDVDPERFYFAAGITLERLLADRLATRITRLDTAGFDARLAAITALEEAIYEPARQDELGYLRTLVQAKDAIAFVAEDDDGLLGMTFAAPLELWPDLDGPRQDAHRGRHDTLYSADTSVAPRARGRGIGDRLRRAVIKAALAARTPEGGLRYAFITGRNQVGGADRMWQLNQRYGAYQVSLHAGQYGRLDGLSRYYRIPLRRHDRRQLSAPTPKGSHLEFGDGVNLPTGLSHPLLDRARDLGVFDEAALTKLTVSNFITPPYVRYAEYLRQLAPAGNRHLYFTSSPDEMVDKSLRVLKHKRRAGRLAVSLVGGHMGDTTAAARSLSDPAGDSPAHGFFGFPQVPHPGGDPSVTLEALEALVAEHGAEALIGVYVESVQAHTGRPLTAEAWAALCAWRDRTGVPLVLSETTTGMDRAGVGFWWVDAQPGDADVVLWWAGGQIGHVFTSDAAYVAKPLSFISTWDGDELSATRLLWQLYARRGAPVAQRGEALHKALIAAGVEAEGLGLYRVAHLPGRAAAVQARLAAAGVRVRRHGDHLIIAPPLTVSEVEIARFGAALTAALGEAD